MPMNALYLASFMYDVVNPYSTPLKTNKAALTKTLESRQEVVPVDTSLPPIIATVIDGGIIIHETNNNNNNNNNKDL